MVGGLPSSAVAGVKSAIGGLNIGQVLGKISTKEKCTPLIIKQTINQPKQEKKKTKKKRTKVPSTKGKCTPLIIKQTINQPKKNAIEGLKIGQVLGKISTNEKCSPLIIKQTINQPKNSAIQGLNIGKVLKKYHQKKNAKE